MPVKHICEQQGNVTCGSLLHEEKPFVQVLRSDLKNDRCDHCYNNDDLLKCSGCSYVRYCGFDCQKAEWASHKFECQRLQRLPSNRQLPNAARLIAKIIMKLKKGGDQEKGFYGKNNFRVFKDLMSHYPDMKSDPMRVEHALSLYGVLNDFLGENNMPSYPEFVGIYGRMVINSFSILDGEMITIGTGIYLGASTIDHSCSPNAVAVFSGTTLNIRALTDIQKFDWSKVRISYIDCLSNFGERRSELWSTFYFNCDCGRCADEEEKESAAACQNCDGLVLPKEMGCSKCMWEAPPEFRVKYEEVITFSLLQHKEMKNIAYLDACKVCLEKEKGVLHPSNLVHIKTLDLAFEAAIQLESWDEAVRLGKQLIPGFRKYYGTWHPLTGLLHLKLGKILMNLGKETALPFLESAERILRASHGTRHYIYRKHLEPLLYQAKHQL